MVIVSVFEPASYSNRPEDYWHLARSAQNIPSRTYILCTPQRSLPRDELVKVDTASAHCNFTESATINILKQKMWLFFQANSQKLVAGMRCSYNPFLQLNMT